MAFMHQKGNWVYVLSLSLLCGMTMTACSKKDKEQTVATETEETVQEVAVPEVVMVPCDDASALNSLSDSIKNTLKQQTRSVMTGYANQVGTSLDTSAAVGTVDEVLVDLGTPKALQNSTASGMQTCQASLSLTLPSESIYRANEVYNAVDGKNMPQMLAAYNIRLNNNMLVDENFTYVVGTQNGQKVAKVIGQPAIIRVVADMVAKSQLKALMDANQPAVAQQQRRQRPATERTQKPAVITVPTPPRPVRNPPEPTVEDQTQAQSARRLPTLEQPTIDENGNVKAQSRLTEKRVPTRARKEKEEQASSPLNTQPETTVVAPDTKLNTPTDNSIDMVIIEENATY
ncbi:hypothetical protein [Psychrobacter sp. I-STPA6b]|uniref:hypothetical protein n=1 Tax=Psychrobacter sp. I-STPA6b TaxID=2585718 RepID=UPI001D0CCC85|nr:hypothetical protein [Psychrobacter sp. I-STPA6b]